MTLRLGDLAYTAESLRTLAEGAVSSEAQRELLSAAALVYGGYPVSARDGLQRALPDGGGLFVDTPQRVKDIWGYLLYGIEIIQDLEPDLPSHYLD